MKRSHCFTLTITHCVCCVKNQENVHAEKHHITFNETHTFIKEIALGPSLGEQLMSGLKEWAVIHQGTDSLSGLVTNDQSLVIES